MDAIILIADGWGNKFGGINSFNYSLCKAMGIKYGSKIRIVCVVPNTSIKICKEVELKYNIKLISLANVDFTDEEAIVDELKKWINIAALNNIFWIGHDVKTGFIALKCRGIIKNSKCAIIHHMAYKEYYTMLNNNPDEVHNKIEEQTEILNQVDFIFANGPKLMNSALNLSDNNGNNVHEIVAGLAEIEPKDHNSKTIDVIAFGRIEKGDTKKNCNSIIKQSNLAVAAWASFLKENRKRLNIMSTNMELIGYTDSVIQEGNKELKSFAEKYSGGCETITAGKYIEDQEALFTLLKRKSLCFMLSREEGFGLTGFEAISAGVPVIISKESGLYQFLKNLRLDNYVLSADIQGSFEEPYFTDSDLYCVKEKLFEIYSHYSEWKQKAIELREVLLKKNITWECCADEIIHFIGASMDNTDISTTQHIDLKAQEVVEIQQMKEEFRIIKYEELGNKKWFDRYDIYMKLDKEFQTKRIGLVEGFENSGKVITVARWLKTKKVDANNILYFVAAPQEDPNIFLNEVEQYLQVYSGIEDSIYILFDNFSAVKNKIYYDVFISLLDKYEYLNLIIFSENTFQNIILLKELCNIGRVEINELNREDVTNYFKMYDINITAEEVDKLKPIGYLPVLLRKCVDYILDDKISIETAVEKCISNGIENIVNVSRLENLDADDNKLASVLSLFTVPFAKIGTQVIINKSGLSVQSLNKLCKSRVIIEYTKTSYYMPPFYRDYFIKKIDLQVKKSACIHIAQYYYTAYKHEWRYESIDSQNILHGIYACKYMQEAEEVVKAEEYILHKKYGVFRKALKKGYYEELICILLKQYELQKRYHRINDWCVYNLAHCMCIVGRFKEANYIVNEIDLNQIKDESCKLGIFRLKCEIMSEYKDASTTLAYLEDEYTKVIKANLDSTTSAQLDWIRIDLHIENGDFSNARKICDEYLKSSVKVYEYIVANTYLAILKRGLNEEIKLDDINDIQKKFEEQKDERGKGWVLGIKGILQLEKGEKEAEDSIIESITIRRKIGECSKSYRQWLSQLCQKELSEEVRSLLKTERNRIFARFEKRFLPKDLLEFK